MYLHGMSSGDFAPALAGFFGSAAGLSASVITRLTTQWQAEQRAFAERDLSDRDYVYVWADGVHFNVRLDEDRLCCLVIVGVRARWHQGAGRHRRRLPGVDRVVGRPAARPASGAGCEPRCSPSVTARSGSGARCATCSPRPATQRCWVHKVANVLNALPKSVQPTARRMLAEIRDAEDRDHAVAAINAFAARVRRQVAQGGRQDRRRRSSRCSPSTTSRPSTGSTSRPRTRSSRRSRPCGCAPRSPRARAREPPGWPWRSS